MRVVAYCGHALRVSSTLDGKSGVFASVGMALSMDKSFVELGS